MDTTINFTPETVRHSPRTVKEPKKGKKERGERERRENASMLEA